MRLYEVKKNLSLKENFCALLTILGLLRVPSCLADHRCHRHQSTIPLVHLISLAQLFVFMVVYNYSVNTIFEL